MYKIRGADQKEYGPVGGDIIRQWISERRASAQTLVQAEGGTWQPLSLFPEFADALAVVRPAAPPPPIAGGPPGVPRPTSSGLAITSLVLGVLSIACLGLLTGIPAIITGHIAYRRTRNGLAVAGLIMGYLSFITSFILAGLLLPALAKAKSRAHKIQCVSQMKQIGLAARVWAHDRNLDNLPPDFITMSNELVSLKVLICPSDSSKTPATSWATFGPDNVTYEFIAPGAKIDDAVQTEAFRCPIHENIGYSDGSVSQHGR